MTLCCFTKKKSERENYKWAILRSCNKVNSRQVVEGNREHYWCCRWPWMSITAWEVFARQHGLNIVWKLFSVRPWCGTIFSFNVFRQDNLVQHPRRRNVSLLPAKIYIPLNFRQTNSEKKNVCSLSVSRFEPTRKHVATLFELSNRVMAV